MHYGLLIAKMVSTMKNKEHITSAFIECAGFFVGKKSDKIQLYDVIQEIQWGIMAVNIYAFFKTINLA